jgi:hypothetical protein
MQIKPLTRTHLRLARLIRRRKASHREFDLAVGKLAPVFDNSQVTAGRKFVEDLARLKAGGLQWQPESFALEGIILPFAQVTQIARPIRDIARLSHCVSSKDWGISLNS